jgi:hypothetical protein
VYDTRVVWMVETFVTWRMSEMNVADSVTLTHDVHDIVSLSAFLNELHANIVEMCEKHQRELNAGKWTTYYVRPRPSREM